MITRRNFAANAAASAFALRSSAMPHLRQAWPSDLPTMAESGLAGFDVAPWWGLFLPAKTAPAVVARLHSF